MKVIIIKTQNTPEGVLQKGNEYDLPEGQASTWVGCGIAKPVNVPKRKKGDDD